MRFEAENLVFTAQLQKWLTEGMAGKFVVIKDDEIVGFFTSADEAFRAGAERFGIGEFFMSQVLPSDSVHVTFMGVADQRLKVAG